MKLSIVIPAFNASATIGSALGSIADELPKLPPGWDIEVIVVDDGSADGAELRRVVETAPRARLVVHESNRGMCAARNSGIRSSTGDIVMILDADDAMAPDWAACLREIVDEWPSCANLCYAACRNEEGHLTVSRPDYTGLASFEDMLRDRFPGEYVPLFRGDYIRKTLYLDLGTRKSCGLLSYLSFAADGPIWITNKVMRIYRDKQPHSVTRDWANPKKAAETVRCYEAVMKRFESEYKALAPRQYRLRMLRLAVYRALAGEQGAWGAWRSGAAIDTLAETVAAAAMIAFGADLAVRIVGAAKRIGLVKSYG